MICSYITISGRRYTRFDHSIANKREADCMKISYSKLWKLVVENKMNRKELARAAEISANTVTKLAKNEAVSLEVLVRICKVFHCDIGDIMEIIEDGI